MDDIVTYMDDLDRSRTRRAGANAVHPELVDSEVRRRALIGQLIELRRSNGLTQAAVADLMSVGQSVIAEIESARTDVRLSTLDRYARAVSLGRLELELVGDALAARAAGGVAETLAPYGTAVDEGDFWATPTLDDLVAEQRTGSIEHPRALLLQAVSERDWDDFFAAMGMVR